jgi:hypothetical protein
MANVEDVCIIDEDVELLLPKPKIDHWEKLSFEIQFSNYKLKSVNILLNVKIYLCFFKSS